MYTCNTKNKSELSLTNNTLAYCCMPTLMKIKPASIVNFQKRSFKCSDSLRDALESELSDFDCNYEILFENDKIYVVLIYHVRLLEITLNKNQNNYLLEGYGYEVEKENLNQSVSKLKVRFLEFKNGKSDFPHELGIFLGYPIEDVESYIINKGEKYKMCGFWKVYHDVESAEKTFELYRWIRKEAVNIISSGKELTEIKDRCMMQGTNGF